MQPDARSQGESATRRRGETPHFSSLDGARGLAVAGVLLFHGGHLRGGYLGVDFFFTLSGFLITSLLLAEASCNGRVNLGGFWARRARRLLPALTVLMIGVAVYSATLAKPAELAQVRGDAFATLGYVANWHEIFAHQSYFALFTTPSPLNHTWSLAIEEQFYLIWPLVFVGLSWRFTRSIRKAVLATSLGFAALSSVLMLVLYDPTHTNRAYFGTDTRAAAILFGAALATWLAIHGPVTHRRARLALEVTALAAALVLAIAWARLDGQSPTLYRGGFLVCGLAATAIIAAAVHPEPGPVSRALSLRPFCWLGLISYGVYLYHWPLDVILNQQRVGLNGWPLFAFQTSVSLALAIASYKLIEQPIRHGALTSTQWRRLAPAIAIALVVTLAAATARTAAPEAATVANVSDNPLVGATLARDRAPQGSIRVLLVGNSVANALAPEFSAIRSNPPLWVLDADVRGCEFPPQLTDVYIRATPFGALIQQPPCDPEWEADVVARFHPSIIFWLVSDPTGAGGKYQGQNVQPCDATYNALYEQRLKREVAILGKTGGRVVIPTQAYSRFPGKAHFDSVTDCQNELRRKVAAETGAQLVDLFSYICPHGQCRVTDHGVVLRPDGLHYSGPGGLIVAKWLMRQVH